MTGFETSDRGFRFYDDLATAHGHVVRVYESSCADRPCVWLAVELAAEDARGGLTAEQAHAHLTVEQAEALIVRLRAAIDGHYQTRGD